MYHILKPGHTQSSCLEWYYKQIDYFVFYVHISSVPYPRQYKEQLSKAPIDLCEKMQEYL